MTRMMLRVAGLVVLFGSLSVAPARADSRFSIHVGIGAPPVAVAPGPYGYHGYYAGYRGVPGGWVPRGRYVSRHWDKHDQRRYERDRRDWERSRSNWEGD